MTRSTLEKRSSIWVLVALRDLEVVGATLRPATVALGPTAVGE